MNDEPTDRPALDAAILPGEQLLQAARVVAEEQDAVVWRLQYSVWLKRLYEVLSVEHGDALADDFVHRLEMPGPGADWRSTFDAEVRAVESALATIRRLLADERAKAAEE